MVAKISLQANLTKYITADITSAMLNESYHSESVLQYHIYISNHISTNAQTLATQQYHKHFMHSDIQINNILMYQQE